MNMAAFEGETKRAISGLTSNWAGFVALGSFAIYVLGYLVVRFHLTVLGVGTDLTVVDERYFFAGAKLLVYLLSTLPILILIALILLALLLLVVTVVYLGSRVLNKIFPEAVKVKEGLIHRACRRLLFICCHPQIISRRFSFETLAVIGIVFSVVKIQFVLRQAFLFEGLLLKPNPLPVPLRGHWFMTILSDPTGASQYYYFAVLTVGTILSFGIFLSAKRKKSAKKARALIWLLGALVVIEFLFLPINYGILIFDKAVPRVQSLDGQQEVVPCSADSKTDCQEAWLIWEGSSGHTYLLRDWKKGTESKRLVTFPVVNSKRVEIVDYDYIFAKLFTNPEATN